MMQLFELASADKTLSFSPFVWRSRMALKHKECEFESVLCGFMDKSRFEPSGSKTVPVLKDGETWVPDSWAIACYLEETYPDAPSLFSGDGGRIHGRFISLWCDQILVRNIFSIIVSDIVPLLTKEDQAYFVPSREALLGMSIADTLLHREKNLERLHALLGPFRATIKEQGFMGGSSPSYGDYAAFGPFQWACLVSDVNLLDGEPVLQNWFDKMSALFDGYAQKYRARA